MPSVLVTRSNASWEYTCCSRGNNTEAREVGRGLLLLIVTRKKRHPSPTIRQGVCCSSYDKCRHITRKRHQFVLIHRRQSFPCCRYIPLEDELTRQCCVCREWK
ncbi:unnamed protein product [Ectocarpus sp. 13 AM-2016]